MTSKTIRAGIVGLTDAGETFAEHLLEMIQIRKAPIEIAAVVHDNPNSPVALGFQQNDVPVFTKPGDIATVTPELDIVFDLSGDPNTVQKLRMVLLGTNNLHTYVVPRTMAALVWYLFGEKGDLPLPG